MKWILSAALVLTSVKQTNLCAHSKLFVPSFHNLCDNVSQAGSPQTLPTIVRHPCYIYTDSMSPRIMHKLSSDELVLSVTTRSSPELPETI